MMINILLTGILFLVISVIFVYITDEEDIPDWVVLFFMVLFFSSLLTIIASILGTIWEW